MNDKMTTFKYIVQCYKCNCSLIEKNPRENSLHFANEKTVTIWMIWTTFQSCSVYWKAVLLKISKRTCWYPMSLDRKHSTKVAVLLLYITMVQIWLNNVKHLPRM